MKNSLTFCFLVFLANAIFAQPCTQPTLKQLPEIKLCEGDCHQIDGFLHCKDTTILELDVANCQWISQKISVDPIKVIYMGKVAAVKCSQPCVDYFGETYCKAGFYLKKDGCIVRKFEIGEGKDTVQLGLVGKLTCAKGKIEVLDKSFADGGWHFLEDACTFSTFFIAEDFAKPFIFGKTQVCQNETSYSMSFHVLEATPPFEVNGIQLAGNFFSATIPSGQGYDFLVKSKSSGCKNQATGSYDCTFFGQTTGDETVDLEEKTSLEIQNQSGQTIKKSAISNIPDLSKTMVAKGQIENFYAPNVLKINALSPNNRFTLFSANEAILKIRRLEIFAADGKIVFQKTDFLPNDPALGWDGSAAKTGGLSDFENYKWVAEIEFSNGQIQQAKGPLKVIR